VRFRDGGGVRLHGEIGELWMGPTKVGLLYRWQLEGWERKWQLEAERYRLEPAANGNRNVDLVLDFKIGELHASGSIWTDFVADGTSHRAIVIRGGALKLQRAVPAKEASGVSHR